MKEGSRKLSFHEKKIHLYEHLNQAKYLRKLTFHESGPRREEYEGFYHHLDIAR